MISLLANSFSFFYSLWILLQQTGKANLQHHLHLLHIAQFLNIFTQASVIVLIIGDYFTEIVAHDVVLALLEGIPLVGGSWTLLLIALFDLQTLSIYSILGVSISPCVMPVLQFLVTMAFVPIFITIACSTFIESMYLKNLVLAGPILLKVLAIFVFVLDVTARLYILTLLSKVPRKKAIPMKRAMLISALSFVLDAIGLALLFLPSNDNTTINHAVTGMTVAIAGLHFSLLKLHFMEIGIVAFSGSKSEKRAKEVFSANDSASIHSKISIFSLKKSKMTLKDLAQRSNGMDVEEIRQKEALSPKTKDILDEM